MSIYSSLVRASSIHVRSIRCEKHCCVNIVDDHSIRFDVFVDGDLTTILLYRKVIEDPRFSKKAKANGNNPKCKERYRLHNF